MGVKEDIGQLAKNQAALQKNFVMLRSQMKSLSARMAALEGGDQDLGDDQALPAAPIVQEAVRAQSRKETSKPIENLGFKIFGGVGFALLLFGLFFLYTYAKDQGWIGARGEITLGIVFRCLSCLAEQSCVGARVFRVSSQAHYGR
ncbi:MAG: hypothetical protein HC945_04325, partial [Nitrosarchaeum sp.]|nr:hypothetical protein [Nitrosarchaeum sp.]